MNLFFYIILILVVIICLLIIAYIVTYNKIQNIKIRIDEAETIIDDNLRKRFDIMSNLLNILDNEFKIDNKYFKEFAKLKESKISNFDLDRKITEGVNLVKQIKFDNKEINEDKNIKEMMKELRVIEEHLEAAKAFYNTYTSDLNKLIQNFPSTIVAKFHGIKVRAYFDGKNLNDDDINDFKL